MIDRAYVGVTLAVRACAFSFQSCMLTVCNLISVLSSKLYVNKTVILSKMTSPGIVPQSSSFAYTTSASLENARLISLTRFLVAVVLHPVEFGCSVLLVMADSQ